MRWLTESQVSVLSILWRCTTISELMINEQIRDREVRLIGANGEQLGIMSATKVNNARKFLTKGNKVKVTLRFRGREMAHMQSSKHILDEFAQSLSDIAVVEKAPKVEGRSMTMFLTEKR